jgi:hypothetical protein
MPQAPETIAITGVVTNGTRLASLGREAMRILAAVLTFVMLSVSTTSLIAHAGANWSEGDVCPMAAHHAGDEPCVGAPCPCGHNSSSAQLPAHELRAIPEPSVSAIADRRATDVPAPAPPTVRAGFDGGIDHPPQALL